MRRVINLLLLVFNIVHGQIIDFDTTEIEFIDESTSYDKKYFEYTNNYEKLSSFEGTKFCRYRNEGLIPEVLWIFLGSVECYNFTDTVRLKQILPLIWRYATINNVTYRVRATQINNVTVMFDYTDEDFMKNVMANVFKTDRFLEKYIDCCESAFRCCQDYMNDYNIYPNEKYPCPAIWDGWTCYPPTERDTTTYMECPDYATTSDDRACIRHSEKYCFKNRTWNQQTDYSPCATASIFRRRHTFHLNLLIAAIVLTAPAILILSVFRKLRILRVILHRNLISAIVVKNILTCLSKSLVLLDALKPPIDSKNILNDDGIGCKVLAVVENLSKNVIFTCMFIDGFYLHKLIVRAFKPDPDIRVLYGIIVVFSSIPTLIWSILMGISEKGHCWMVDADSWYQWVPDGYKYGILVINVLLLADILRVLFFKYGKGTETNHTKETLRATLVLIPVFGIPLIITSQRYLVNTNSCLAGDIFYYVSYSVEAIQGIAVAIIFCYINKDVHKEIKNSYRKWNIKFRQRYGLSVEDRDARRRTTAMTNVGVESYS